MAATKAFHDVNTYLGRDPAVSCITIDIDTTKWSTRKRNIITKAIETGVADCGRETAWMLRKLMQVFDCGAPVIVSHWSASLDVGLVRKDLLDELITYTVAWLRVDMANHPSKSRNYNHRIFLQAVVDNPALVTRIPLPGGSRLDRTDFVVKYITPPSAELVRKRMELVDAINDGRTLTINFKN